MKYREGGIEALCSRKVAGKTPKLFANQLKKIYRLVVGVDPRQVKFEFALWTRGMIRDLIKREFDVRLSEVSAGRLLKKLGLSPQRPIRWDFQQDELLVVEWMARDFPAIKKLAREQKTEIYFGDESSVRSDYYSSTTWAPRGKTPVFITTETRHKVNLISAINPRGSIRLMASEGNVDAAVFITFLKRLIAEAIQLIFLIVDNHSAHRSS